MIPCYHDYLNWEEEGKGERLDELRILYGPLHPIIAHLVDQFQAQLIHVKSCATVALLLGGWGVSRCDTDASGSRLARKKPVTGKFYKIQNSIHFVPEAI